MPYIIECTVSLWYNQFGNQISKFAQRIISLKQTITSYYNIGLHNRILFHLMKGRIENEGKKEKKAFGVICFLPYIFWNTIRWIMSLQHYSCYHSLYIWRLSFFWWKNHGFTVLSLSVQLLCYISCVDNLY